MPGARDRSMPPVQRKTETSRNRRKMQSVTMSDVAAMAKVSPSTVSLYLRKPQAVSLKVGAAVEQAINKLGYVPNLVAGGLASAGSRVISIIVPSLRNAFFAETVTAMETILAQQGYHTLIGHTEYSPAQEEALVRAALSWGPAGVVLTGLTHSENTRHLLEKAACPVVEMWEIGRPPIDTAVGFSHAQVGAAAARHLLSRGRSRLAFLGARLQEDTRARQRADAFKAHLEAEGRECVTCTHPAHASTELGGILLGKLLATGKSVDGIACSNDTVALGVLFECQRRGIAVPSDLAVIGFGDLEFTNFCVPPLTTIRPFGHLIAQEVVDLLTAQRGKKAGSDIVDTGFSLVHRGST